MEYQKIVNLLNNMTYQPFISKIKNWVKKYIYRRVTYNTDGYIRFKTQYSKLSFCYYIDP